MKIAVLGSAPSSMMLAPYKDKSWQQFAQGKVQSYPPADFVDQDWEIWACSPGVYGFAPRITRFFEVHRWEPGAAWFSPEYCQFLRDFRGPVYTGGKVPEILNHVVYPTQAMEAEFSPYFLTSSLSLMMALAITEIEAQRKADPMHDHNDDVIGMWGVDMSAGEEWEYQRPGCQFFILEALRRGIAVYIPPESDILRPMPIYGVSEWDTNYIKATARAREISNRIANHGQIANENQMNAHYLKGAQDNMQYFIKTFMSEYGLPPGTFLKHSPGTGLGAGPRVAPPIPMDFDVQQAPRPMIGDTVTPSADGPQMNVVEPVTAHAYTGRTEKPKKAKPRARTKR